MRNHEGMQAMVLAAGVGSRLEPLTSKVPKPLVPFANRPVMEHMLRLLKRHGIRNTISNLHYLPKLVSDYFGTGFRFGMNMQFIEEPRLSGDAGGVRACRRLLKNETFIVVMADVITDMDLSYVIEQHKAKGAVATIALKQVVDVERFGVAVLDQDSLIKGFQEKPSVAEAKSNLVSTGVYVFEPEVFDYIGIAPEVGFGKDVFPRLIAQNLPVLGVEVWGYWSDVGTIDQYKQSTLDALEGLVDLELGGTRFANGWMDPGGTIGEHALVDGVALIGRDSYVSDRARLHGSTVIGDNCLIDRGAFIEDSIIWPGTVIGANARISGAIIGNNCLISANAQVVNQAVVEPTTASASRKQAIAQAAFGLQMGDIASMNHDGRELDAEVC